MAEENTLTEKTKKPTLWDGALKRVKGENTNQLIENFTAEMTLVAEGLCRCDSPILTVAVVSRIAGGIYIPRRRPSLCRYNAENVFMLQVSAFPQEALGLFSPYHPVMGALDSAGAGPRDVNEGVIARILKKLGGSK